MTNDQTTKQPCKYRALQIFQSIAGLGSLANLELGNIVELLYLEGMVLIDAFENLFEAARQANTQRIKEEEKIYY